MLNFQLIVSKLIDHVYLFIKMYGVKGKLFRTYLGEMGSFFLDFVTQYFVEIFSESLKSFFTNKFRNCSIFNETSQK